MYVNQFLTNKIYLKIIKSRLGTYLTNLMSVFMEKLDLLVTLLITNKHLVILPPPINLNLN